VNEQQTEYFKTLLTQRHVTVKRLAQDLVATTHGSLIMHGDYIFRSILKSKCFEVYGNTCVRKMNTVVHVCICYKAVHRMIAMMEDTLL
jgi:hypothetical protein